jgi:flavin-binding protein dodecin
MAGAKVVTAWRVVRSRIAPFRSGQGAWTREGVVSVARVTEISSTSSQSFEDAVRQGLERAAKTLRGVTAAWIKDQRVRLRDGKIEEYQVNLQITFVLEG